MKVGQAVSYLNCNWYLKEIASDGVLLRSVNKNCSDRFVAQKYVKYIGLWHYVDTTRDRVWG